MEFNIGQSIASETPHPMSIHYLVPFNYLLVPEFILLEGICPISIEELLQIIKRIREMALDGEVIRVRHKRIAYRERWESLERGTLDGHISRYSRRKY
jgi:hypothetical protein